FAAEREDLAGLEVEIDVGDDGPPHGGREDREVVNLEDVLVAGDARVPRGPPAARADRLLLSCLRHHWPPAFVFADAWAIESAMRFVPIVSSAIASTGNSTPAGSSDSAMRFSLIMRPQSAAGGCIPKPRNDSDAIAPIE